MLLFNTILSTKVRILSEIYKPHTVFFIIHVDQLGYKFETIIIVKDPQNALNTCFMNLINQHKTSGT